MKDIYINLFSQQKVEELIHASIVLDSSFIQKVDNEVQLYFFYCSQTNGRILLFSITSKQYYQLQLSFKVEYKFFYQNFFYSLKEDCLYKIDILNNTLISSKYYCFSIFGDSLSTIQYNGKQYLIAFGRNNTYLFKDDQLIQFQPKTHYIILEKNDKDEEVVDLNSILNNDDINKLNFNIGLYLTENYYLIGLSDNQNIQKFGKANIFQIFSNSSDVQSSYIYSNPFEKQTTFINTFNYDSGVISLVSFVLNGNYIKFLPNSQYSETYVTLIIWVVVGILSFIILLYLLLILRRCKQRDDVMKKIEVMIFQQEYKMTRSQFYSKYELDTRCPLGSGGFSDVYKAKNIHKTIVKNPLILNKMEDEYACKWIIFNNESSYDEQTIAVTNEIQILIDLRKFSHVIQIMNYYIDKNQAIITFELANLNLQELIKQKQEQIVRISLKIKNIYLILHYLQEIQRFSLGEIVKFLNQVGNTLVDIYLIKKITHRDIKPENILIKDQNFFISDFGISQSTNVYSNKEKIVLGTFKWMSPELKNLKMYDFCNLNQEIDFFKSDMFSLGLVLLNMLTLRDISQVNQSEEVKNIRLRELRQNNSKKITSLIINLISKMLETNPDKRPDANIFKTVLNEIKAKHRIQ